MPADSCSTREERVNHIAEVMERLEWERGRSGPPLARLWGVTEATVRDYAAEASRRVTADEAEVKREITVQGLDLLRGAHREGERKDWAAVAKVLADVSGANAPAKHQVGPIEQASPEKARQVMQELFGSVTPGEPEADSSGQRPKS